MGQRCRVGYSVNHRQHAKLHQTSHNNKCNTGAVSSWATSCFLGCFMSKPDSWFTAEQKFCFFRKEFTLVFRYFRPWTSTFPVLTTPGVLQSPLPPCLQVVCVWGQLAVHRWKFVSIFRPHISSMLCNPSHSTSGDHYLCTAKCLPVIWPHIPRD